jgi:hypothetical protein
MPFVTQIFTQNLARTLRLEVIGNLSFRKSQQNFTFVAQSSNLSKVNKLLMSHRALHDENSKILTILSKLITN